MTFIIAETIKYLVLQRRGNITYPVFTKFLPKKEIRQPLWVTDLMKNYWL